MIFLVRRKDFETGYEQYRAFTVKADSTNEAQQICEKHTAECGHYPMGDFSKNNVDITEITDNSPNGIILGDYHNA